MPLKEITDRHGRKFQWTVFNGHAFQVPVAEKLLPLGLEARFKELKNLNIREDDVMICTFPKTGLVGCLVVQHVAGGMLSAM